MALDAASTYRPLIVTSGGKIDELPSGQVLASDTMNARTVLSAARDYYVRTDGSDSNDGSANDSGHAYLTIQKAIDVASSLDTNGFNVTIHIGNGTYTGLVQFKTFLGSGEIILLGDTTTPANVTISATSPATGGALYGFFVNGTYRVKGVKLTTITSGHAVNITNCVLYMEDFELGAVAAGYAHFAILTSSKLYLFNYKVSGGATYHYFIQDGAYYQCYFRTITITGTPVFNYWCYMTALALGLHTGCTFSGGITAGAQRYYIELNSVLNTAGGGATYFPGSIAGATATGGQYV